MKATIAAVAAAIILGTGAIGLTVMAETWDQWRYAVSYHKNDQVLDMLARGQDVNMQDGLGWTALHVAAEDGNADMVTLLLDHGARTDLKTTSGKTALDVAWAYPNVQALIRTHMAPPAGAPAVAGAKPNGICAQLSASHANDGRTPENRPRLVARDDIWYNHPDQLTELLEDCVDVNSRDSGGETLLHTAAERDRVEIAKILLAHGADKAATDNNGNNPAVYATSAEMKALLGPAQQAAATAATKLKRECAQKYQADVGLCSDSTCRVSAQNRWQRCLKTGSYW